VGVGDADGVRDGVEVGVAEGDVVGLEVADGVADGERVGVAGAWVP
jgi:hypothetical protein